MSVSVLQNAAQTRRSVYVLNKNLPISNDDVRQIVEHAITHTPSSFNSQSTRLVVLFGDEHEKLWQITTECLQQIVPADSFEPTAQKMAMFKAAAGTVLFFEDDEPVKALQEQFSAYAPNFPIWAEHSNAMHQYAIWTTLAAAGVGANLQHYNPIIDDKVASTWGIPSTWKLKAQLVFGGIAAPAGDKSFADLDSRLKVFG